MKILIFILLLFTHQVFGQALVGQVVRLKPTSLPNLCNTGDIRIDQDDTNKAKACRANAWEALANWIGTATGTSLVLTGSLTSNALTSGRVTFAGTSGILQDDADLTFATDTLSATKVAMSSLTSGRVPIASTSGLLVDDADFTFSTDTLSATKLLSSTSVSTPSLISTGAIGITPAAGSNLNVSLATTGDFVVNTDDLYVDTSTGFVGIGTSSPTSLLHVAGAVVASSATIGVTGVTPVVVSGNGGAISPNGTYSYAGTYNGKNYYQLGTKYIWWQASGVQWIISSTLGSIVPSWFYSSSAATPPLTSGWSPWGGNTGNPTTAAGILSQLAVDNLGNTTTGGSVGIGTVSPVSLFHVATSTTATGITTTEQASADADSYDLIFRKARGTVAAPTVITTADELGTIRFNGYSGAGGYVTGAAIKSISEGTIATTRVPAHLSFWTGTDAAPTVLTEQMRIDKAGNVGIGTTAPTAVLHLKAGTATASTAPLKLTSGTNLTAAEAGAVEWDGVNLFITATSGPTRKTLAYNPMTTGGDIVYGGASGVETRLANGSAGQVLTSAGTTAAPTWSAAPGVYTPTASKTSAYNAVNGDYVLADSSGGTFAVTLPTATAGHKVAIKKTDTSFVAVTVVGTVDGVSGDRLDTQNEVIEYLADGTNWHQISRKYPSVWTSYTPTGSWSTNTSYTGYYRRVGDSLQLRITVAVTGAPDAVDLSFTSAQLLNGLTGLSLDTGRLSGGAANISNLGSATLEDAGTSYRFAGALYDKSATILHFPTIAAGTSYSDINSTAPFTFASGDSVGIEITIPITSWK